MRNVAGTKLRVLLVDDHEVVRQGIRTLLQAADDIDVVAEADSAHAAVTAADEYQPDVVVVDVLLEDGSGIEATREIRARHPEMRVLMLTASNDHEALFSAIIAGASGYVLAPS
jgi:DNA-binding NarL/FixJ family response regulator